MVSDIIYHVTGTVSGIINLASLASNAFAIRILLNMERRSKTSVNLILLSLSLNNVLQSSASQIFVTSSCFMKGWLWGKQACKFYAFWTYWLALTSIYLIVLLSWQHYKIVRSKSIVRLSRSLESRVWPIILCVIVAFIWCMLPLMGWSSYGLEGLSVSCSLNWHFQDTSHRSYNISTIATSFVFPILCLAILYTRLFLFVRSNTLVPDSTGENARRGESVLIRLGIIMEITFLSSWSPYAVASLINMVHPTMLNPLLQTIPSLIAKGSTLALPAVFLCINKDFKIQARQLIKNETRRSNAENVEKDVCMTMVKVASST